MCLRIAAGLACTMLVISAQSAAAQTNSDACQAPSDRYNPDQAIASCTAQIQSGKLSGMDLAAVYQKRGLGYEEKHDYDRAIADLDQAIRLAPQAADALYRDRGVAYDSKGDLDHAIADYDQAIRLNPQFASVYVSRGAAYAEKQVYDHAIADFNQAVRLDPTDIQTYESRGAAYVQMQDYDHALADFDQTIRLSPQDAVAYLGRSISYANKGDLDHAMADADQYVRLAPTAPNGPPWRAKVASNRGYAYLKQKRYREAIADYDTALKIMPDIAVSLYGRGLAKRATGDAAGGNADIAAAEKIEPGVGEAFKP